MQALHPVQACGSIRVRTGLRETGSVLMVRFPFWRGERLLGVDYHRHDARLHNDSAAD
jgi:hypothetical protein